MGCQATIKNPDRPDNLIILKYFKVRFPGEVLITKHILILWSSKYINKMLVCLLQKKKIENKCPCSVAYSCSLGEYLCSQFYALCFINFL